MSHAAPATVAAVPVAAVPVAAALVAAVPVAAVPVAAVPVPNPFPRIPIPPSKPPSGTTSLITQEIKDDETRRHMNYIFIRPEARAAARLPTLDVQTWVELWKWMKENFLEVTKEEEKAVREEFVAHHKLLVNQGVRAWPTSERAAFGELRTGYRGG